MTTTSQLLFVSSALALGALPTSAASVLTEAFGYSDGAIVGATGSPWVTNSGTAGQADVTTGALNITASESEDIAAPLSSEITVGTLTATFEVTFSALPTTGGAYFAHFIGTNNNFIGRVWAARPTGTAANNFRLGISNSTNTVTYSTVDLSLDTTHTLTLGLDIATDLTSLSINGGTAIVGSDAVVNTGIDRFGFRQAAGEGILRVDNLLVDHVPEPASALLGTLGLIGLLRRRR